LAYLLIFSHPRGQRMSDPTQLSHGTQRSGPTFASSRPGRPATTMMAAAGVAAPAPAPPAAASPAAKQAAKQAAPPAAPPAAAKKSRGSRATRMPPALMQYFLEIANSGDEQFATVPPCVGMAFSAPRFNGEKPAFFIATASQQGTFGDIATLRNAGVKRPAGSECFGLLVVASGERVGILPGTAVLVQTKPGAEIVAHPTPRIGDDDAPVVDRENLFQSLHAMFSEQRIDEIPSLTDSTDFDLAVEICELLTTVGDDAMTLFLPTAGGDSPWKYPLADQPLAIDDINNRLQRICDNITAIKISKPRGPRKVKTDDDADMSASDADEIVDHVGDVSDDEFLNAAMDVDPPASQAPPPAPKAKSAAPAAAPPPKAKTAAPAPPAAPKAKQPAASPVVSAKSTAAPPAAPRKRPAEEPLAPPASKHKAATGSDGKPVVVRLPEVILPVLLLPVALVQRASDFFESVGTIGFSDDPDALLLTVTATRAPSNMDAVLAGLMADPVVAPLFAGITRVSTLDQMLVLDCDDKTQPVTVPQADGSQLTGTIKAIQPPAADVCKALLRCKLAAACAPAEPEEEEEEEEDDDGDEEEDGDEQ
jgi:hypothetical protein